MNLDAALTLLAHEPAAPLDLAELALALAHNQYPDLDVEAYLGELEAMAHEIRPRLAAASRRPVRLLCRYLFEDMGFQGNNEEYYDDRNSYLNEVMDRRKGIPITLSAVAMAVGGRAGLEVVGVGLPGHFVAKAVADGEEVLFDPFHGGRVLTPADCERLVLQSAGVAFEATPDALRPAPLGFIVTRLLTNLKGVYLGEGEFLRAVRVMERLSQLNPADALLHRDLGLTLLHAERPGRAIDHLNAYLEMGPGAEEAAAVREFLDQARALVARWN